MTAFHQATERGGKTFLHHHYHAFGSCRISSDAFAINSRLTDREGLLHSGKPVSVLGSPRFLTQEAAPTWSALLQVLALILQVQSQTLSLLLSLFLPSSLGAKQTASPPFFLCTNCLFAAGTERYSKVPVLEGCTFGGVGRALCCPNA